MMVEHLLASYAAWLLACAVPVWLGSYLFRSILNTIDAGEPAASGVEGPTPLMRSIPAAPAQDPTIHLPAAA